MSSEENNPQLAPTPEPARHFARAVVATVASLALTACTNGGGGSEYAPGDPFAPASPKATAQPNTVSGPVEPEIGSYEWTQSLMKKDAPLHLIYVDTANPAAKRLNKADWDTAAEEKTSHQLETGNKKILDVVKNGMARVTGGRYLPSAITVTKTESVNAGACASDEHGQSTFKIADVVSKYVRKDAINVAYVNMLGCIGDKMPMGGYATVGGVPVVLRDYFPAKDIVKGIGHELGHGAGLEHAAKEICRKRIEVTNCKTDETGDPDSIMGYASDPPDTNKYSVPELNKIGLLQASEIIKNPGAGTYTLAAMGQTGAKLLEVKTPKGILDLSWEKDSEAGSVEACVPESKSSTIPQKKQLAFGESGGENGDKYHWVTYTKSTSSSTHSLQVRLAKSDGTFALMPLRPQDVSACPDAPVNLVNNIVHPTVLYLGAAKGGHKEKVSFLEFKGGKARVQIQNVG